MYQGLSIITKKELLKEQLEITGFEPEDAENFLRNIHEELLDEILIDDRLANVIYLFLNSSEEKNKKELRAIWDFSIKKSAGYGKGGLAPRINPESQQGLPAPASKVAPRSQ